MDRHDVQLSARLLPRRLSPLESGFTVTSDSLRLPDSCTELLEGHMSLRFTLQAVNLYPTRVDVNKRDRVFVLGMTEWERATEVCVHLL